MLNDILAFIKNTDGIQVELILNAVLERKRELFPDWDIQYLAVPKHDDKERQLTLEYIIRWMNAGPVDK